MELAGMFMIGLGVILLMVSAFTLGWYMRGEVEGLNKIPGGRPVQPPRSPECDIYGRGGGRISAPFPPRLPTMPSESPKEDV